MNFILPPSNSILTDRISLPGRTWKCFGGHEHLPRTLKLSDTVVLDKNSRNKSQSKNEKLKSEGILNGQVQKNVVSDDERESVASSITSNEFESESMASSLTSNGLEPESDEGFVSGNE